MKKYFWYILFILLLLVVIHYIYALSENTDNDIINIEHEFYLLLLCLPAISSADLKYGKYLLYLICILNMNCLYHLPEMQIITALNVCAEGNCEVAEKLGYVKINNGKIEYIEDKIEKK